jgi:hypothetical protein
MSRLWLVSFALIAVSGLLMNNAGGRAATQNQGNTGAPGDEINAATGNPRTCQSCHNTGVFNPTLEVTLKDAGGNTVTQYEPGQVYQVQVQINNTTGTPNGYGMQIVSLLDDGYIDVAGWSNPSANGQIAVANTNGRSYFEHNGVSDSPTFTADWTAPPSSSGTVTFYVSGNAVSDNGTSSGDNGVTAEFSFAEFSTAVADQWPTVPAMTLLHDNASGSLDVKTNLPEHGEYLVRVFNLEGTLLFQQRKPLPSGQNEFSITDDDLCGIVLVSITGHGRHYAAKGIISK